MKLYLRYRKKYIEAERAKTPDQPNRRIAMKIDVVKMTEIVEEAHKIINEKQRTTRSIEKTFRAAGQDPWVDCDAEFKAHLDKLSELPLYGLVNKGIETQRAAVLEQDADGVEMEEESAEGQVMRDGADGVVPAGADAEKKGEDSEAAC